MYQKPMLQRFGSFRELTQIGFLGASDGITIAGVGTSPGSNCALDANNPSSTTLTCSTS